MIYRLVGNVSDKYQPVREKLKESAMKNITVCVLLIGLTVGSLLICEVQEAMADNTETLKPDDAYDTYTLEAPDPGENLTVIVDVPKDDDSDNAAASSTTINKTTIVQQGSNVRLRGGVATALMFPGRPSSSLVGGVVGEIGYKKSVWRVQGTFLAGNCGDGVALDSSLAVMATVAKHVRIGFGPDLFYCSDVSSHPKEKAKERLVGGSLDLEFNFGPIALGGKIGMGALTTPIPNGRMTQSALYGGVTLSATWGR